MSVPLETTVRASSGSLIYRQSIWTRMTHWTWVVCLFFLLFSGLQIFNAHPTLYVGQESGVAYEVGSLSFSVPVRLSRSASAHTLLPYDRRRCEADVLGEARSNLLTMANRPHMPGAGDDFGLCAGHQSH